MTEIATKSSAKPDNVVDSSATPVSTNPAEASTLITEQRVMFSSAALALPPAKSRRFSDAIHAVASPIGAWLASAARPPAPARYPRRHGWLDNSLMSREMDRL
jgi:hypothetical protein